MTTEAVDHNFAVLYTYILGATSCVLFLIFAAAIVHTCVGSKFKNLYVLFGLFLASNAAEILEAISLNFKIEHDPAAPRWSVLMYGISMGIVDLTYSTAHLLLAFKYRKVAYEVPKALEGEPITEEYRRTEKTKFRTMLTLCIVFPVLEVLCFALGFKVIETIISGIVVVVEITSGVIFLKSLVQIRRFYKERLSEEQISSWAMCL